MVDGGTMAGISLEGAHSTRGAHLASQVCRIPDSLRSRADAGPEPIGARLAVCGRIAAGRGDASISDTCRGSLREAPDSEPERRADSTGRPLEIWIQGYQVDCQDPLGGKGAPHHVVDGCAE